MKTAFSIPDDIRVGETIRQYKHRMTAEAHAKKRAAPPGMIKALSIKQPWATLIVHHGKNIENRTWRTKFRGRFLVHASAGMTRGEYEDAYDMAAVINPSRNFPTFESLKRGGIVGSVELVDCVEESDSPWYMGSVGFLLRDPKPLPFTPWKGRLGFFDVPDENVAGLLETA